MIFDPNPDKTSMLQAINEVYFGKTPEILAIEKQLHKFRSKYIEKYNLFKRFTINSDDDLLKFNRMMEDYFGFSVFSLCIFDVDVINAVTIPLSLNYDTLNMDKNLITKKGFKFNKQANYSCFIGIFSGIIFNSNYSTSEVMAVILHEIGHNFFTAVNKIYSPFKRLYSVLILIKSIINMWDIDIIESIFFGTNAIKNIVLKTSQFLRKNKIFLSYFEDLVLLLINAGIDITHKTTQLLSIFTLGFYKYISSFYGMINKVIDPTNILFLGVDYNDERFADNFATMYGYGGDLSSALNKMTNINYNSKYDLERALSKIPILSNIYVLNSNIVSIIFGVFDKHPTILSRTNDQLSLLEKELKKEDLDPKMRKEVENNIKEIKRNIKEITNVTANIKNINIVRNIYFNALYNATDSKDIKDFLFDNRNKFEIYDNVYNEKLEGGK